MRKSPKGLLLLLVPVVLAVLLIPSPVLAEDGVEEPAAVESAGDASGVDEGYSPEAVSDDGAVGEEGEPNLEAGENPGEEISLDAQDEERSGTFNGMDWRITADGELVLGREGEEQGLSNDGWFYDHIWPWYEYELRSSITSVRVEGTVHVSGRLRCMFHDCSELVTANLSGLDISAATDMSNMFSSCLKLSSLDLSGWDTSSVTDMSYMFSSCSSLVHLDLSGWDTKRVTGMDSMFYYCSSLSSLDLSGWDTSCVIDMSNMFLGCSSLSEVALGVGFSFAGAGGNRKTQLLEAVWVAVSDGATYAPSQIPDNTADTYRRSDEWAVSGTCMWKVDGDGALTVRPTHGDEGTLADWDSGSAPWFLREDDITSARFVGTVHAPSCHSMFLGCSKLVAADLSGLDVSSTTDMSNMFFRCSRLSSLDVSGWDTSNVTKMAGMFNGCSRLPSLDVSGWDTSNVTNMAGMFSGCSALATLDVSGWKTAYVTNMSGMFGGCTSLTSLVLSGWNTSFVTDMSDMFNGCSKLAFLDVSGWDTSSVTDMGFMFNGCSSLTSLDVTGWNTMNVSNMLCMFDYCSSLVSLDLSGWETWHVKEMRWIFSSCSSLASIDLTGWAITQETEIEGMFYLCSSLCRVKLGGGGTKMGVLPSPAATGGRWLSEATGRWFTPTEIAGSRVGIIDTYVCEADTHPASGFTDVGGLTPHFEDILWLAESGISTGFIEPDGTRTFRGMDTVKRQDMAAFLYRFAGSPDYEPTAVDRARFSDVDGSTPHAVEIWWLASTGISEGWEMPDGTREFRGMDTVKRQDMAAFLRRLASWMGADVDEWGFYYPFRDVDDSTPHCGDIFWLASTGVTRGWDMHDGTFEYRGMNDVVRQDMAAFLYRLDAYIKGRVV